jgi:hypothetical protein
MTFFPHFLGGIEFDVSGQNNGKSRAVVFIA